MSSISSIAISGLNAATTRIANATSNIVNASSTNYTPTDVVAVSNDSGNVNLGVSTSVVPAATGQGVDLASQIVSLKEASSSYAVNAEVLKIEQKNEKALLDIKT